FDIVPDYTLDVMEPGQPLARLSGKVLEGLHGIMEHDQPDVVVVQGDTTTAFMAALCAYYGYDYFVRKNLGDGLGRRHHIKVAHVEAGLRTGNLYAPFPEEANRRLIAPLAHWHFAPTSTAAQALFDENLTGHVHITGNTVVDALLDTRQRLTLTPRALPAGLMKDDKFVLVTGHRRENYGEGFKHICHAIATLATRFEDTKFVYPVHLNRHVQGPVHELLGGIPNVILTDPADYPDFVNLMMHCHLLLTDSGGLQEEGPALGKPVLVMRDLTERPEGVVAGTAKLVGTTEEKIVSSVAELLENKEVYAKMARAVNPYGDGHATRRILDVLAGNLEADITFEPAISAA
ncbi:MAG: UDP-N-acetylglucosamine 2-epimerase (non-hydrolyzing), partial [Alphaproteobacteria bacterium CG_4_10_14_0_8_um_filter_53_9]